MRKAGDRPTIAIKQEIRDGKIELRRIESQLDQLKAVKESKIPYW